MPISSEIGQCQRTVVQHLEKPLRVATVLNVGLTGGIRGAEIQRISLGNESHEVGGDPVSPSAARLDFPVQLPRPAFLLRPLDGGSEGDVADGLGHGRSL